MLVLDPSAVPSAVSAPRPLSSPSTSTAGQAAGIIHAVDGELIAIDASGDVVRLAAGDPVAAGDVLMTPAGGQALIDLADGGSLAMGGGARAEIRAADGGHAHVVVHAGAFVVVAEVGSSGEGAVTVETGAALVAVEGGSLTFHYALETGLSGAVVPGADPGTAMVRIVNASGTYVLDGAASAFAVAHWSEPPAPMSAAGAGEPAWLPAQSGEEGSDIDDADAAGTGGQGEDGQSAQANSEGAEPDGGPAFETGAGPVEDGDPTFVFASAASALRGLSDHAPAAAPLPALAAEDAIVPVPPRAVPSAHPGHSLDALFLWQPPIDMELPPAPLAPPAPHLRGWERSGRTWDTEGYAWVSSGDREWPAFPDRPLVLVRPTEGNSMAALEPRDGRRAGLESFLGLQHDELNALVDGVIAHDGSAIRTSIALKAGQTLVFDVMFDAIDSLPSNDYAAFTVAHGGIGEAFVLSSVATTGSLGASPWQTMRYTAGASGTFTIGFVVVNDDLPEGLSRLYVDGMRSTLGTADLQVITARADAFGGRFELLAPKPHEDPGEGRLIAGFESEVEPSALIGRVAIAGQFTEPDGCRSVYSPTEGASMAVLHANGAMRTALETFLGLEKAAGARTALPIDGDGSLPNYGAATKLSVAVAAGDRISFDWMFDAGDQLPDNDFAVFTVAGDGGSRVFKLADIRATGDLGASGWHTSVYTATGDEELTIGFAVINDRISGLSDDPRNSRLLVDNVWLNRDFADGYQLADLGEPGDLATLPTG